MSQWAAERPLVAANDARDVSASGAIAGVQSKRRASLSLEANGGRSSRHYSVGPGSDNGSERHESASQASARSGDEGGTAPHSPVLSHTEAALQRASGATTPLAKTAAE